MQATGTIAIIPKARGIYSRRITQAQYEEMMRRRTVPELAAMLKRHPYFGNSLATLSTLDPHRGQIEELLDMDVFKKYEALVRYDFSDEGFSSYYLEECELRAVLNVLRLFSIGQAGAYAQQMPEYLVGKTRVDLLQLAAARNFEQALAVCAHTPYHKVLKARFLADPLLRDFVMTEAALLRFYYDDVVGRIDGAMGSTEAKPVRELFLQQAEVYNMELLYRVKTYYAAQIPPEKLRSLLLPYRFRVSRHQMEEMVNAPGPQVLLDMYAHKRGIYITEPEQIAVEGGRRIAQQAERVLRMAQAPMAVLVAMVSLAKLEKENVVNVVEGVRYGLAPEKIRAILI